MISTPQNIWLKAPKVKDDKITGPAAEEMEQFTFLTISPTVIVYHNGKHAKLFYNLKCFFPCSEG